MPLGKYKLASEWYANRLQENNGDKKKTIRELLELGLYQYQNYTFDTPRDKNLENYTNTNLIFILSIVRDILDDFVSIINIENLQQVNRSKIDELRTLFDQKSQVTEDKINLLLPRDGSKPMEGDLNLGGNRITNLSDASELKDLLNVRTALSLIVATLDGASPDMTPYLVNDASKKMIADLDMGGNKITELSYPLNPQDLINLGWLVTYIASSDYFSDSKYDVYLKSDGSLPLTGNLDLNNHKVINVGVPVNGGDGATKKYIDDSVTSLVGEPVQSLQDLGNSSPTARGYLVYVVEQGGLYYYDSENNSGIIVGDDQNAGCWNRVDSLHKGDIRDLPKTNLDNPNGTPPSMTFNGSKWLGVNVDSIISLVSNVIDVSYTIKDGIARFAFYFRISIPHSSDEKLSEDTHINFDFDYHSIIENFLGLIVNYESKFILGYTTILKPYSGGNPFSPLIYRSQDDVSNVLSFISNDTTISYCPASSSFLDSSNRDDEIDVEIHTYLKINSL